MSDDPVMNSDSDTKPGWMSRVRWQMVGIAAAFVLVGIGVGALLANIVERQVEGEQFPVQLAEIGDLEVDPEVWGRNFPRQYDSYLRTQIDGNATTYGGSDAFSKLDAKPFLRTAWAGYGFSVDYNEERGHYYSQIDQARSGRTTQLEMPGTCINCHTGNFVRLMDEMGWEGINTTPYNDLREHVGDLGVTCADCHDPDTMQLRLTRPALINALDAQGIDWTEASRQEMRTYVCAQCHVEYYFRGESKELVFPWSVGTSVEAIEQHYDEYGFKDWEHQITGAPMIKIQHPEFEMFTSSTHFAAGVACADCHMPYIREGGVKVSDHWVRSPLDNLNNACQGCHRASEEELETRILTIQNRTKDLMESVEVGLEDAIYAIAAAMEAGVPDDELVEARSLHRAAQLRWDFVDAENSMGFHSPQEAVRVLGHAADLARQAELSTVKALAAHGG